MKTNFAILLATAVGTGAVTAECFILKRLDQATREREELRLTSEQLKHRNDQLTALYNVFNEITATLSLRYVVNSTLREANKLMNADMAVLRVLRGDDLVAIGAMAGNGQEIKNVSTVKVGESPTGRAAKHGHILKIDANAEQMMKPVDDDNGVNSPAAQTGLPPLESGIVSPLIVGARIVGTLSVWSRKPNAFNSEDERIMEMMASQVATAVVAADSMEKSESRAVHDALTGLPNRHQLNQDLAGDLANFDLEGRPAVVAMVDVDHFKMLNDDFGHKVGDVTLQKIASVLRTSVRDGDRVYRYGGEEFVLVFADTSPEEATSLVERLRRAVESTPLSGDNLQPVGPVTISIGLALLPEHGLQMTSLIEKADVAMYRAKEAGRNRVMMWQPEAPEHLLVA